MAENYSNTPIRISKGEPGNLGKSTNLVLSWNQLFQRFLKKPSQTRERHAHYQKASVNEKNRLKGIGGWFLGAHVTDGKRKAENVHSRDIITLDLDNLSVEEYESIVKHKNHWVNQFEMLVHTTRSHTLEEPRLRLIFLADGEVEVEQYEALTRIMAHHVDERMETVDPVSFRIAQMMYLPSISSDQEYKAGRNPGRLVDPIEILESWPHDWRDMGKLPRADREEAARERQMKAEDPREKHGVIGAFCNAYSIEDVISEFLSDAYGEPDPNSTDLRYTYLGGHSQYGAVVYGEGGGLFMYSWHGTDPACEQLCNAWDLVRVHKFGSMDADAKAGTHVESLASQKEMKKWASKLPQVNAQLAAQRIDIEAHFDNLDDLGVNEVAVEVDESEPDEFEQETDEETRAILGLEPLDKRKLGLPEYPGQTKAIPRDKNWTQKLEATLQGEIKPTVANVVKILIHDPRFRGLMALNAFTGEVVATRTFRCQMKEIPRVPLKDPVNGDLWSDFHDAAIKALLSSPNGTGNYGYGMSVPTQTLSEAIRIAAGQFQFHPVIEHLLGLAEWDGKPRLERMWIDYMGTRDTAYYRETAKLTVIGAIGRLFAPGLPFDFVPILISKQDRRKSTFVRHLGFGYWGGELTADFHNQQLAAEQMMGKLFLEMAEITNMKRSDAQSQKAFISRVEDKVRLAYDRRAISFRRQNLFIGTTNEHHFLTDDQNRRFWPIHMDVEFIDTDAFLDNRDQIWAEALAGYKALLADSKNQDPNQIHFRLSKKAKAEAENLQDSVRVDSGDDGEIAAIQDFLETKVPMSDVFDPKGAGADFEAEDAEPLVLRVVTCSKQLVQQALGEELPANSNAQKSRTRIVGMRAGNVGGWERYSTWKAQNGGGNAKVLLIPGYGRETAYVRSDATHEEILRGYRIVENEGSEDDENSLL